VQSADLLRRECEGRRGGTVEVGVSARGDERQVDRVVKRRVAMRREPGPGGHGIDNGPPQHGILEVPMSGRPLSRVGEEMREDAGSIDFTPTHPERPPPVVEPDANLVELAKHRFNARRILRREIFHQIVDRLEAAMPDGIGKGRAHRDDEFVVGIRWRDRLDDVRQLARGLDEIGSTGSEGECDRGKGEEARGGHG
jgi:hypothetical protein